MSYGDGFGRSGGGGSWGEGSEDMFVPIRDCGKIIGRGGSRIRELQDQSGCRIKVCQDDEGDGTRRVQLNGSEDAVYKAKELILQILEAGDDRGARMQQQQQSYGGGSSKEIIQVQSNFVGRIIGKGGSRIRELQDDTGCRINVSRNEGTNGLTDVELIGTHSEIQNAKEAIYDLTNQSY